MHKETIAYENIASPMAEVINWHFHIQFPRVIIMLGIEIVNITSENITTVVRACLSA